MTHGFLTSPVNYTTVGNHLPQHLHGVLGLRVADTLDDHTPASTSLVALEVPRDFLEQLDNQELSSQHGLQTDGPYSSDHPLFTWSPRQVYTEAPPFNSTLVPDDDAGISVGYRRMLGDFSYPSSLDISSHEFSDQVNAEVNGSGLPYTDFALFNTDQESSVPHFDAEFFPEPLPPSSSSSSSSSSVSSSSLDTVHLSWTPNTNVTDSSLSKTLVDLFLPWNSPSEAITQFPQFPTANRSPAEVGSTWLQNTSPIFSPSSTLSLDLGYSLSTTFNVSGISDPGLVNSSDSGLDGKEDLYTWTILAMAPLVVFGIAGNTLVILAISLERRLQNVTNYFLLSLAITDLLVSLIVMPFSIINVLTGRWPFGLLLCDFFVTSDVLMCTSSILHLCTISLERYIGIRYPLWAKNKSKRVVLLKIFLVWTIALAISSPITILGVVKEDNVLVGGACILNNEYFIIYGSMFAFYIPLAIMVLMYALTVRMLNIQARLCNSVPAEHGENQPMIRRSTSRRNWQIRRKYGRENLSSSYCGIPLMDGVLAPFHQRYRASGMNRRNNTVPGSYHHYNNQQQQQQQLHSDKSGHVAVNKSIQKKGSYNSAAVANNNNTNSCLLSSSSSASGLSRFSGQNGNCHETRELPEFSSFSHNRQQQAGHPQIESSQNSCTSQTSSSSSVSPSSTPPTVHKPKRLRDLVRKHHVAVKAAGILMKRDNPLGQHSGGLSASVRRDNSVRTEQKASKVLGVVFMIFVVCWAPFFTVNILTALCSSSCQFQPTLITAFVWLGYVSSTLNPIIYTIFNNIFRITFIKLLRCRYRLLHRARRSTTLPGIRNGLLNCSSFCPAPLVPAMAVNTSSLTFIEESTC